MRGRTVVLVVISLLMLGLNSASASTGPAKIAGRWFVTIQYKSPGDDDGNSTVWRATLKETKKGGLSGSSQNVDTQCVTSVTGSVKRTTLTMTWKMKSAGCQAETIAFSKGVLSHGVIKGACTDTQLGAADYFMSQHGDG